jgi:hypothetical protein
VIANKATHRDTIQTNKGSLSSLLLKRQLNQYGKQKIQYEPKMCKNKNIVMEKSLLKIPISRVIANKATHRYTIQTNKGSLSSLLLKKQLKQYGKQKQISTKNRVIIRKTY